MIVAFISLISAVAVLFYRSYTPKIGGDFSALTASGPWTFSNEAKKLNLLYIGYAKCPDVCPMALSYSQEAFKKLTPEQLSELRFLFLSVDVENDTPQSVSDYAQQFHESFQGLTGSAEQIDSIVNLFKASYIVEKDPKSYLGYSISHTDRIFFLNKNGFVIDSVTSPRSSDLIIQKIKEHL